MKHRWAAPLIVLALSALMSQGVAGQGGNNPPTNDQRMAGSLKQNYPNPFNPITTIPFDLGMAGNPSVCADPSRQYRVTLKIYNILTQPVATPIIQGGEFAGRPIEKLLLRCGEHKAFWDGTMQRTGEKVPSGTYIYILEVDGRAASKKMFVAK